MIPFTDRGANFLSVGTLIGEGALIGLSGCFLLLLSLLFACFCFFFTCTSDCERTSDLRISTLKGIVFLEQTCSSIVLWPGWHSVNI